ncbi:hypothetical protein C8R43DRAFT_941923 [Mycena crocata]|nr:hypothetical protein C8R43DRAFT_941923 [Mycena crocata]
MQRSGMPRVSRRSFDTEVVEDSEPEREAMRQKERLERKKRKLAATNPVLPKLASPIPKVIDISDVSIPASPVQAANPEPTQLSLSSRIIEISDSSVDPRSVANDEIISVQSSLAGSDLQLAAPQTETDDDEEIVPTLNLARFAFANPRPLQARTSSSASTSNSETQTKAPTKTTSKRLVGEFSDAELKKLSKCVSCDMAWTARKSGAQKLVHIRSCAKKSGLTDETVGILIKKEIANAPDDAGPSKRKKQVTLATPTTPPTLLEDTVRDAAPKRKGKRIEAVDVLKTFSETRDNIKGRARMLLGSAPFSNGDGFIVQTQAVKSTALTSPIPTQAFGASRLGVKGASLLGDQDSEPDLPPATQAFAPSKLGGRTTTGTSGGWGYESGSDEDSVSHAVPSKESSNPLVYPASSVKEVFLRSSPGKMIASAPPSPAQVASDGWSDDGAYMHYDPELNRETFSEQMNVFPLQKAKKKRAITHDKQGAQSPKAKQSIRVPAGGDELDSLPAPSKTKRSRKKADDEFDENWELRIKEKIINDHDLHLRILRYEPINFEVFLQLAAEGAIPGGRLKFKLRSFLDKQAINFYGGETGRTGRR